MSPSHFALYCGLALLPKVASAQESPTDTVPFHQHQWAAQFGAGTNFASLGALRFTTSTHAWLIDFHFAGGHSHTTQRFNDTLVVNGFTSSADVALRLGRRFYQGRGKSLVSYQSVGVLGGFTHQCQGNQLFASGNECANGWSTGGFGELGAAYLITPRFSIGGTAGVGFSYQRSTTKTSGGVVAKQWSYQGSIQGLSFAATVYF